MLRKHVRRPEPMPRGLFYHIECDCGWTGKVAIHQKGRRLAVDELTDQAERIWIEHVPPRERRTYLLLDTRPPEDFRSLDEIRQAMEADSRKAGEPVNPALLSVRARAAFKDQRAIRGNFLMPEGSPVHLISTEERDGLHYGRFRAKDGPEQELPVGEVRLADGTVMGVDE